MKNSKKILSTFLLIIGLCAACFGCVKLVELGTDTFQTMQEPSLPAVTGSEDDYEGDTGYTSEVLSGDTTESSSADEQTGPDPAESQPDSSTPQDSTETAVTEEPVPYVSPYADYFDAYPDMVAWLYIPDTLVDYPVMWTPGDETYYLYRHYDGTSNQNGSLLLDTDSSLSPLTTNLIIHGHDMRSGAMFGKLTDYADQTYCEQHKEMLLFTADCERKYQVISVFYSQVFKKKDTVFKFYKFFQADTEEEFNDFYDNIKKMSLFDTGVTARFGDRFITLSTCSSHVENGRFVVVAKEITDIDYQE